MPRKFAVLTTFNQQGLQTYGQRFLNSFVDRMPDEIGLYIYAERCTPVLRKNDKVIKVFDHEKTLPDMVAFKKKYHKDPRATGMGPDGRRLDAKKAFKWDAIKFCNKVYAVCDTARKARADGYDVLIWMDADSYVHSKMPLGFLEKFIPEHVFTCFLGRGHKYTECGWYSLNLKHEYSDKFIDEFQRMYDDAENGIFKEKEWHDSYIYDVVRRWHESNFGVSNKDISSGIQGEGHPLINSELGQFFDHMKGDRKRQGHSERKDLKVQRHEDYWKTI